uniref:Uncharacterized protein n=1 Tax=Trypanosoma congolense (strain IL3000) TaxID=1068625 RepID=G0UPC4_TRYCI|nr:conserved hypothetical protein [Trypanosoma congolense IL3000]
MTERSLLIRCAQADRYFAVGMDFPSARVFDIVTGDLVAVVDVPARNRASLAVVSLTSLSLGSVDAGTKQKQRGNMRKCKDHVADDVPRAIFVAAGLSNGTLLLHNVVKDEFVGHICVSDTQRAIISMAFSSQYLFCVTADRLLHVIDCVRGERTVSGLRVQQDPGAIAVTQDIDPAAGAADSYVAESSFRIFVSGPTNAVYGLRIHNTPTGNDENNSKNASGTSLERLVTFASHASRTDIAWMGGTSKQPIVVTSSAQEGVVRVWDARPSVDGHTIASRCRRSLVCGQRIVDICVREPMNFSESSSNVPDTAEGNKGRKGAGRKINEDDALVVVTTFTGSVLVWALGYSVLTSIAEPLPRPPTFQLVSQDDSARLLFAALLHPSGTADNSFSQWGISLLLLRGRFATPQFDVIDLCDAASKAVKVKEKSAGRARATWYVGGGHIPVFFVPSDTQLKSGDVATSHTDLETVDNAWATHGHQQHRRLVLAARAMKATTEGFVSPVTYHASSVADLPTKRLTLEQRLKQLQIHAAKSVAVEQHEEQLQQQNVLGLATIPLYQALHANDTSAVMELLTVASRTNSNMRATIMALQLPYCLQLLQILSQRVRGASPCSPLFQWVDAIIRYRGMEMYCAQKEFQQKEPSSGTRSASVCNELNQASPPKDFVAPLLHQYSKMTALYDQIASMYGRLSIFKSVYPSERDAFADSHDGITFPVIFEERRNLDETPNIYRIGRKRDVLLSKRVKNGGRKKAAEKLEKAMSGKKKRKAFVEADDEGNVGGQEDDEDLDFETLDQMVLSDGNGSNEDVNDNANGEDDAADEGEEGREEDDQRDAKRARREEHVKMVAESERGSSYGAESQRSGEEDFSSGSDDVLDSSVEEGDSDDEDNDDSDGSDGTESSELQNDDTSSNDDDDLDEEHDVDEEMAEALDERMNGQDSSNGSDSDDRQEMRRYKRAKPDH